MQVLLPTPKVKSFTESPAPVTRLDGNNSKYKYGKYDLVKPWSVAEMRLHYENNKPFKQVRGCTCPHNVLALPFWTCSGGEGNYLCKSVWAE
jgi:hypothetical protein